MKYFVLIIFFQTSVELVFSQNAATKSTNQLLDLSVTAGSSRGTVAASYVYNWHKGKKQQWDLGLGARLTTSFGTKQDYTTAPARISRGSTTPFIVVVSQQKTANWDTLVVQRPLSVSLNATANIGYHFNSKWSAGFNIDLIGFTVGRKSSAVLTSNGVTRTEPVAKPAPFNILLTGDLDYGSLNSEFFIKYNWNEHWGIRAVYQFVFSEYKTTTIKQTAPDGTMVDRFRNKANNLGIGLSYHF